MKANLSVEDLFGLEQYSLNRAAFRAEVMRHKAVRRVSIGPNLTVYFESKLTIQYQIQEMLRIEKIFEREAIEEELNAYTPLIPDRGNLKATMMLEYVDEDVRRRKLKELKGIEKRVWLKIGELTKVFAIADEDLEREDEKKTSAVHFLRFVISSDMFSAMETREKIRVGVDHPAFDDKSVLASEDTCRSLFADLV